MLWTPADGLFVQEFFQVDLAANGQPVTLTSNGTSREIGTLTDQDFAFLDVGGGYWLMRSEVISLAAIFEVHYNASLNGPPLVQAGSIKLGSAEGSINLVMTTARHRRMHRGSGWEGPPIYVAQTFGFTDRACHSEAVAARWNAVTPAALRPSLALALPPHTVGHQAVSRVGSWPRNMEQEDRMLEQHRTFESRPAATLPWRSIAALDRTVRDDSCVSGETMDG